MNELESIKKYYGLESIEDAEKVKYIIEELENLGDWGNKVLSYFTGILSSVEGTKSFIPKEKVELYKSLFKSYE